MLNEILDAVAARLDEVFGEGYKIYTDVADQGFNKPCFFIQFLELSERPMIGRRYYRETGICIQFMPGDQLQPERELYRVADILTDGLEYITLADKSLLRGSKRSYKTKDKVLSFFVSYSMFVVKEKTQEEPMEGLDAHAQLRRR